ncbi:protein SRG1 [Hordeum vulgare]|nr:protein SRG1 [Hordeum vulgare]
MEAAGWPEPVVRVQSLSESGAATIPDRYVKPEHDRPVVNNGAPRSSVGIPVVDLSSPEGSVATARAVSEACREWGFFQAVNHGVPRDLLRRARAAWRCFFRLPVEAKQRYANSPATYEGYGSRLGVERGAVLDWGDYYFLHLRPPSSLSAADKWPHLPPDLRDATEEYGREVASLCERLMAAMSAGLGVKPGRLQEEFGGADGAGVCVRVNYYPRCPQPELTLGLSSHSDPGGMTVLLADERVRGLQVRGRGGEWVTVDPIADSFIVNVGDQIQVNSTNRKLRAHTCTTTMHVAHMHASLLISLYLFQEQTFCVSPRFYYWLANCPQIHQPQKCAHDGVVDVACMAIRGNPTSTDRSPLERWPV